MRTTQRLDKVLSHMGIGTRSEIKKVVRKGSVTVAGEVVRDSSQHIDPYSEIAVNGQPVEYREFIYLMLHKPDGVLSATDDDRQETVIDLLEPEHLVFAPFPVGRLDKDTEGLLLITNDGKLAHRLLSPRRHVPKQYFARVKGQVSEDDAKAFGDGVILDDGYKTMPAELVVLGAGPVSEIKVTVYEGKYHQVKRMFAARGHEVVYLKRLSMGPLQLDETLEPGEYRELTDEELVALQAAGNVGSTSGLNEEECEEEKET
ncbi:MAG: pseudouridine synthase [Bacillota bacterium]